MQYEPFDITVQGQKNSYFHLIHKTNIFYSLVPIENALCIAYWSFQAGAT